MNVSYGLNSETRKTRLFKTAIWFLILFMLKLLVNNTVAFAVGSPYAIATRASDIPKVGSTVSALELPFITGMLIKVGNFASQFVYPTVMAFALLWKGWKLVTWLPFAGYAAAAAVYYIVGPQSIEPPTGLHALPYYLLIPFVGMIVSVGVQLVINVTKHGNWLYSYVAPCFDPAKYRELAEKEDISE